MDGNCFSGTDSLSRAILRRPGRATGRALLSTSALAGGALRGLVLASGAVAGAAIMAGPADAFTCGNSTTGTGAPPGDAAGATDNSNAAATACGQSANANGTNATATGEFSIATGNFA